MSEVLYCKKHEQEVLNECLDCEDEKNWFGADDYE